MYVHFPLIAAWMLVRRKVTAAAHFSFVNGRYHFRDTLKFFLTVNEFFSTKLQQKGKFAGNHLISNPEPLFPNIPLIPLHYQVDPPNLPKILL